MKISALINGVAIDLHYRREVCIAFQKEIFSIVQANPWQVCWVYSHGSSGVLLAESVSADNPARHSLGRPYVTRGLGARAHYV